MAKELIDLVREGGVVAVLKELAARLQHLFRVAGSLFQQQVAVMLSCYIKRVPIRTLQGIAALG